jgi:TRAP-type transport system periplasmic protein
MKGGSMKNSTRNWIACTVFIVVALSTYTGELPAWGEVIKIKLATSAEEGLPIAQGYGKFAELVNQRSNGRVEIEVYYYCKLGCDVTGVRNMLADTVQMTTISDANMGAFSDALYFMNLPYVFDGSNTLRKIIDEAWLRDIIDRELEKKNLKILMYLSNGGPRHILTTKKQIKTPLDLRGLKFRTTASKVEVAIFENFGTLPTPINWEETYTALDQGTVDGEGLQYTWLHSTKHYEPVKYVCEISYVIGTHNLVVRSDFWKKLPDDIKNIMITAAKEAEAYETILDQKYVEDSKEAVKKAGVTVYTPSKEEMKIWRDAVVPSVWEKFKDKASPEVLKRIRDSQQ